jgi:hypothetical protein
VNVHDGFDSAPSDGHWPDTMDVLELRSQDCGACRFTQST